jgi:hypothetical protein
MARTTRAQLDSLCGHVRDALVARGDLDAESMLIEDRGSDYPYRYAVMSHGGSQYPLGERFWTAGTLWDALRQTLNALNRIASS